jgi:hypothetical protein
MGSRGSDGNLRLLTSLGGGLGQPVKPSRLYALYIRTVKSSIASSLTEGITASTGVRGSVTKLAKPET